jgi:plasmid stabilization system protein ParE
MTIIVKSPVWDDLRLIGERIANDNPDAADRFFTAAKELFNFLARHPEIGRLRSFSVAGVRSFRVPGFDKYLVFYCRLKPSSKFWPLSTAGAICRRPWLNAYDRCFAH